MKNFKHYLYKILFFYFFNLIDIIKLFRDNIYNYKKI